jgi:hypothetical protein
MRLLRYAVLAVVLAVPVLVISTPAAYAADSAAGSRAARPTLHVVSFPRGGAATGDGTTATTANGPLAAFGLALIGIGALTGGFALRRRNTRPARSPRS